MVEEVLPTSEELTPDAGGSPPGLPTDERFLHNTAVMSVGTGLSRLTGFLRTAAMTYAIGVSVTRLADTYNVANTTPNIIYELALGGVLSSVFLPVFVDWTQTHGRDAAWDVAHRVMTFTALVLTALALIGIVAAPWIIDLYMAGSRTGPDQQLATFFLRWFMPQILFYGLGAVATGLLNANRRFAPPMFAPILNNAVAIVTFATFALLSGPDPASPETITDTQRLVLAIGTTLGVVAMTVALWPSLRRIGYRWKLRGPRHGAVGRIARLATWTILYVVVNQIAYLIVIRLGYGSGSGQITAYTIAFVLFQLPHAIFAVSIFTALMPSMSGCWATDDRDGFRSLLSNGIRSTAFIIIPASLGYMALALPITRLLFENGVSDAADSELIASVLVPMAAGLFFFSLFQLLLRAFYAMQDTRTPALVNVGAAAVNIGVNLLAVNVFDLGARGLAIGLAIGYVGASAAALLVMRGRLERLDGRRILRTIGKVVLAGALTALAAWLVAGLLGDAVGVDSVLQRLVQVVGGVLAGLLVFAISALILRIGEVDTVRGALKSRLGR